MLKYLENVITLKLDTETCNGCGMCVNVCPHEVFDIEQRKAVVVDLNACIECGACAINCPVNAIKIQTGAGCATGLLFGALGKPGTHMVIDTLSKGHVRDIFHHDSVDSVHRIAHI